MASGMISIIAIDKKRVPENVIAIPMTVGEVKHFKVEMHCPKIVTSKKKTSIRTSLMRVGVYIPIIICVFVFYNLNVTRLI